jgi:glycosyltransferase involved in cell wall biosynthesis
MLFRFLKYLQPTHYFQVKTVMDQSVFPVIEHLPDFVKEQLLVDNAYQSELAQHYDLSWQAVQKGYIGNLPTYKNFEQVSLYDNYRFIRKNFNSVWVFYVMIVRVFSLHHPFKEIRDWFKTRHTTRVLSANQSINYDNWNTYDSSLIKQNPKVSVVIPTLNRYDYLLDVLKDLEQQDYSNFEVIVVDQSDAFNLDFYQDFNLDIHVIHQKEKALWLARNTAIKTSKGDLIALSEDDVRILPNWISNHLKCLDFFDAQVSAGVFYPEGQQIPKERSFFAIASQFATGNAVLYKHIFTKLGLFDRQFEKQRMGDGEFGMRVYLEGIKSVSNPFASCIDVKAGTGGLREMGSWDAFRPSTFFAPRPIPSVLYYFRRYYGNSAARWSLLRTIPLSIMPYQFKKNKPLMFFGVLLSFIILPVVFYQVYKSWSLASKKIKEGPMVDVLT